uniref:Photolyase/cryptochrome alpha/beta domain-containing protein n=1 Tax=Octopus bimaculoides TaxID=37653 RepID=A0A0L8IG34_OCTBM
MSNESGKHVIHWFRKGLRLHDNPALMEALKGATTLRCIYTLDPWFAGSSQVGINKWGFLLNCLEDLDDSLRKLNSRLFVIRGQPANMFPQLFKEWNINTLSFEDDPEPFGKDRDNAICTLAREAGVEVIIRTCHTLYESQKILDLNGGRPPLTYNKFQKILENMKMPPKPLDIITASDWGNCQTPLSSDHDDKYGVPTLEDLGFETEGLDLAHFHGGESEALARLDRHLERKIKKKNIPPLSLHGQLLWREFFYTVASNNPRFDQMLGNPVCVQIPWDTNQEALAKWAEGMTGFPWIDAIMKQLRKEGWIHHLARHSVACFLTRGDLWLSWEEGMKVFDELLLDADWSVNAGMWMWLSCSSFFQQFFHCYCPVGFGKRIDPNGDFIRHYLPILKRFPAKYIYEPWNAPESVQKTAKCIVGKDYPVPMVTHSEVSRINMERMRQVYHRLTMRTPAVISKPIHSRENLTYSRIHHNYPMVQHNVHSRPVLLSQN